MQHNVQNEGGGVKGFLNNVQKNCRFGGGRHPLPPIVSGWAPLPPPRINLEPKLLGQILTDQTTFSPGDIRDDKDARDASVGMSVGMVHRFVKILRCKTSRIAKLPYLKPKL